MKVCDYCHSAVLRSGGNLQAIGKIADVPDDVSPLQLGVCGHDGDSGFELIGRVRWRYADGAWNEWLALFDDGSTGWLGESMGRYMLLRAVDHSGMRTAIVRQLRDGVSVPVGEDATIDGTEYRVVDVKDVTVVASQGELPFPAPVGLTASSIDLMARDGHCASIQKDEHGEVEVFTGRYVSLADIAATGLRAFEGWPMPVYRS